MPGLILASTSPYRRTLLERLRIPFTAIAPGVDEQRAKQGGTAPMAIVAELARQKAQAVAAQNQGAVVVGCDQTATVDGRVLDKPGDRAGAIAQLQLLRGREHRLLTAVAIAHDGGLVEFVDVTRLMMRVLSDDEIARYVDAEEPFDCAGSYKIEALGIALFERIDTHDQTAITGLPLLRLSGELRQLGFCVP